MGGGAVWFVVCVVGAVCVFGCVLLVGLAWWRGLASRHACS